VSVTTALRVAVLVIAVGASYFLLAGRDSDAACDDAHERVFSTSGGFAPLAGLEPAIDDLRRECDGATGLLAAAETIRQASERRAQLAPLAVDLARESTEIEPDNYIAWATLAVALGPTDADAAREALAHARELNPRLRTPAPLAPHLEAQR
jgi:hypothetical protein